MFILAAGNGITKILSAAGDAVDDGTLLGFSAAAVCFERIMRGGAKL